MKRVESVGETISPPEERPARATLAGWSECEYGCGKVVYNFCTNSLAIRIAF